MSDLNARSIAVLDSVVEKFIFTGQPVGSGRIAADFPERLSSATIRNVMSELEVAGYLCQPYTSAGRMPTERGYRAYVRRLVRQGRLRPVDEGKIREELHAAQLEVAGLLQRACALLSEMSSHVGVVLAPSAASWVIRHIEFVRLGSGRVLVVFVTGAGVVHSRAISVDEELSERLLGTAASYMSERFVGRKLGEVKRRIRELVGKASPALNDAGRLALELGERGLSPAIDRAEVFVEGASRLLESPEFIDAERLQALFATFERPGKLVRLLAECEVGTRPAVLIGADRLPAPLDSCTLIAASYSSSGRPIGALGVLGPTRMEYARTIPVVDAMARATSDMLGELYA